MSVELNLPEEGAKYRVYTGGSLSDKADKIKFDGRRIPSVLDVLVRRISLFDSKHENLREAWVLGYYVTRVGVLNHPDKGIKMVPDIFALEWAGGLENLSFNQGTLLLGDGVFESVQGQSFTRDELGKMLNGVSLTPSQTKEHPVWNCAVEGHSDVLSDYVGEYFVEMGRRFKDSLDNMSVFLDKNPKVPVARTLVMGGLRSGSNLYGNANMVGDFGQVVGELESVRELEVAQ